MMLTRKLSEVAPFLESGGIGVLPTDTLYGLVGAARSESAVERIYTVRERSKRKPFIVLIPSIEDLESFGVSLENPLRSFLERHWPGKVSVVLPVAAGRWEYIHRGSKTVAFRLPDEPELMKLLMHVGPLVAPSANPEGLPPARTIDEARGYFGGKVDFCVDGGELLGEPSTLVRYEGGAFTVLRKGAVSL